MIRLNAKYNLNKKKLLQPLHHANFINFQKPAAQLGKNVFLRPEYSPTKFFSSMTPEHLRLQEANAGNKPWKQFGPYLSERQWGTVREDYSANGDAWNYLSHDLARSKAYRWGEDGIGGISDDRQQLCLSVAFWNGKDAILKERLFGLTNGEGNHGEDVKECYYYLDSTPTHSYLKMLYKYPQQAFPYAQLVEENRRRNKGQPEFDLVDTGVFARNRYFDVFIEYAKADVQDVLIQVTIHNRGDQAADLHVLPHVWFRNTWSWGYEEPKPTLSLANQANAITMQHHALGELFLHSKREGQQLFCENETNVRRLHGNTHADGFYKDGIHEYVVHGNHQAVNPEQKGTKAAFHYHLTIPAGASEVVKLRLTNHAHGHVFDNFDQIFAQRLREADQYYAHLQTGMESEDAKLVHRQSLAGMLWSKQFYYYDVPQWLNGDPGQPTPPPERREGRNAAWFHLNNADIISMPDKWEYPWYAAWDLAFHCIPLAMVDTQFAKDQLTILTCEWYMHPNGQFPAYEWNLSDVNPPVHAWATWRVYKTDQEHNDGKGDTKFLESMFHKLLLNFTWWVNQKDKDGNNIFQGGFLGLDNIGVFDRSAQVPGGGYIEQADGTSWIAMYSLNLMRIALELAKTNPVYQSLATKFFEHFLYIAGAMRNIGEEGISLWDDEDEFFYDVLQASNNQRTQLKVRSMVGLVPLFAVEVLDHEVFAHLPEFTARLKWFLAYRPDLASLISRWQEPGTGERHLLSLLRGHRMKRLLKRMLDETEFLSPYGIRSMSRCHYQTPYVLHADDNTFTVRYVPGESDSNMFGGNSNWRGPIWFPVNYLIIKSLQRFHAYYGDDFKVEYPTGSGTFLTLSEIADALSERLAALFLRNPEGKRPIYGDIETFQSDPHFKDHLLFYEYFHGDNGSGMGASHQTGWTGLVAKLLQKMKD